MTEITDLINERYRDELLSPSMSEASYKLTTDVNGPVLSHAVIGSINQHSQEQRYLTSFKEKYIKIRTDNIALTHEHAIELVKMIEREAALITYEDTQ